MHRHTIAWQCRWPFGFLLGGGGCAPSEPVSAVSHHPLLQPQVEILWCRLCKLTATASSRYDLKNRAAQKHEGTKALPQSSERFVLWGFNMRSKESEAGFQCKFSSSGQQSVCLRQPSCVTVCYHWSALFTCIQINTAGMTTVHLQPYSSSYLLW